jgi:hypothetical protein
LEAFELQNKPTFDNISKQQFMEAINIKNKLVEQYSDINKTITKANLFLPSEIVEEILIDAIIDSCDGTKD